MRFYAVLKTFTFYFSIRTITPKPFKQKKKQKKKQFAIIYLFPSPEYATDITLYKHIIQYQLFNS